MREEEGLGELVKYIKESRGKCKLQSQEMLQQGDNSVEARLEQLYYQGLRSGYQGGHNNCKVRGHRLLLLLATVRHGGQGGKGNDKLLQCGTRRASWLSTMEIKGKHRAPSWLVILPAVGFSILFPVFILGRTDPFFSQLIPPWGQSPHLPLFFTVYYTLTEVWLKHPVQEQQRKRTGIIPMSLLLKFLDYGSCAKK